MHEPLTDLFHNSRLMILDFSQIPPGATPAENIQTFFKDCEAKGVNPRLPQHRQEFNNRLLEFSGKRYLVSRYGEDRSAMLAGSRIAAEGRTLHLGVDVFSRELETVYAPCDGTIVRVGREEASHGYGYYLVLRPNDIPNLYFFFGHLSKDLPGIGAVSGGQAIARLGDFADNENGGWSRHLHIEVITALPREGETPPGYATKHDFQVISKKILDPMPYFPDWHIAA